MRRPEQLRIENEVEARHSRDVYLSQDHAKLAHGDHEAGQLLGPFSYAATLFLRVCRNEIQKCECRAFDKSESKPAEL